MKQKVTQVINGQIVDRVIEVQTQFGSIPPSVGYSNSAISNKDLDNYKEYFNKVDSLLQGNYGVGVIDATYDGSVVREFLDSEPPESVADRLAEKYGLTNINK